MYNKKTGSQGWWYRFQELLDGDTEWPTEYIFKFIAPRAELEALKQVFGDHPVIVRASSRGNYVSVTARLEMQSSDDVIDIYQAAAQVDGVISL